PEPRIPGRARRLAARAARLDPSRHEPRERLSVGAEARDGGLARRGALLRPVEAGSRDRALFRPAEDRRALRHRLSSQACRHDLSPRLWRITASREERMSLLRRRDGPRIKYVAEDAGPYDTITVDKLTPIIGAEIDGVDLSRPLGNRTVDELHRALAE